MSIIFGMSIANAVLGLAMTILLARLLGAAEYGRYSFLLSILTMLTTPLAYGLRQTILRETSYACTQGINYPKQLWIWACKTAFAISLPISAFGIAWAAHGYGQVDKPAIIFWLLAVLIFTPLVHVTVGALQGLGDVVRSQVPEYVVRPSTALILLMIFAICLPRQPLDSQVALAFYATATVAAATYGFYYLHRRRPSPRSQDDLAEAPESNRVSKSLLMTVAGFSSISIIQVLNDNIDTLLLGLLEEPEALGRYRVAIAVSTIASVAIIAVNTVIAPRIARLWMVGQYEDLQRLISLSTAVTLSISVIAFLGLLVAGKLVISILFGAQYEDAIVPLLILSGGRCLASAMGPMTSVLNQTGHERYMLAGLAITVILNTCLNLYLIPLYSSNGAAIATAVSMCIFATFITIAVRKKTGIRANPFFIIRTS